MESRKEDQRLISASQDSQVKKANKLLAKSVVNVLICLYLQYLDFYIGYYKLHLECAFSLSTIAFAWLIVNLVIISYTIKAKKQFKLG